MMLEILLILAIGAGVAAKMTKEEEKDKGIIRGKTIEDTTIFLDGKKSYKGCHFKNVNFKF